jgi:2-hydroxy-6-oxonona-2,4-dienedioate hydrolase
MSPDPASLDGRARVHRLRVEDVRCVWREWGAGTPVVLVHGGTGSWLHWVRNIPALAASHRVLVPDMAGFGESSDAPPGLGAAGQARLLLAGLRQLLDATTPVALVGFSFGGIVGGLAAAQADRPVRGLMLVGAVGLGIDRGPPLPMRAWKHLGDDPGAVDAAHRHNLATLMLARPDSIGPLAMEVQRRNAAAARFYSKRTSHSAALAEALPRVPAPVAGVWGSEDVTAARDPSRVADRLHSLRPDASLDIIRGAGHWVQFEAASSFDAICLRWLAAIADAGGPR